MSIFYDVVLYNKSTKEKTTIKMEEGVTFENKNFRYKMNSGGKMSIFDKNTNKTTQGNEISITDYQCRAFMAVANNNDETQEDTIVLSTDDIQTSINQYEEDDDGETLGADLGEFLRKGYKVHNPKAFDKENKFSAYITNGKDNESSVLAFKFEKEYFDTRIKNIKTNEYIPIKMEKGVSFENNGAIYRMNNDGLLAVFDKKEGEWKAGINEIQMTPYQISTFKAMADNTEETENNKKIDKIVYSKADIISAMDKYKNNGFVTDMTEYLKKEKPGYRLEQPKKYTANTALFAYVTNGIKTQSAELIFKYGSAKDAVDLSDFIHNNDFSSEEPSPKPIEKPKNTPTPSPKPVEKPKNTPEPKKSNTVRRGKTHNAKKMQPSTNATNLIKKRETCILYTYDDLDKTNPRKFIKKGMTCKGTLTIGWGHTKGVKKGKQISQKEADKYLNQDMQEAVKAVQKYVKVPITQNQFDALVSFTFNVGKGAFKKSDLLMYINKGNFNRASQEFPKWIHSKGRVCRGLIERRKDERALFDK